MKILKEYQNIIFFLVIAVLAVGGYFFLSGGSGSSSDDGAITSQTVNEQAGSSSMAQQEKGSEILGLLLKTKSISLERKLLEKDTFKSLKDFSQEIKQQEKGRDNPFEAIEQERSSEESE